MQLFTYSSPRFNPYGDEDLAPATEVVGGAGAWRAPRATGALDAHLTLPGSKSLTNRELVLSALADGPSLLRRPLHSRDSSLMIQALRSLGVTIEEVPGDGAYGADLRVTPPPELSGSISIDCGLAGTVMRFLPPIAALALGPVAFDGDDAARRRPMRTTVDSLRALGVDVNDDGRGSLPFSLWGTGSVRGGDVTIDASASSQFVSGLLLAAARFTDGITLRHAGDRLPSLPHIDMTIAALEARGVSVTSPDEGVWVVAPGPIRGAEVTIEPDLSNAAPFLIAAVIAGGTVAIDDWPESTTQVGADLIEILPKFGAEVRRNGTQLVVDGAEGLLGGRRMTGVDLDLSRGGELAPAIVALAALAESPSRITGIEHLRGHETDRLAALVDDLTRAGGTALELSDGIALEPSALHGAEWGAFEDHRMAHAGAIIGLAVDGIDIDDIGATAKTLPEFAELWMALVGQTSSTIVKHGP
jgi:3-phosphoshikimate 1-carboxyvinyltransferase